MSDYEYDTSETEAPAAQILTRGVLNSLTTLDAGDVVECYALTRLAKLKPIFGPVGNETSNMLVKKSSLAFRYMPRAHDKDKGEFELTLEYGPQRTGLLMDNEAMPNVNGLGVEGKFVSWENEGKVYYNLKIDSSQYLTAHYIAPVTGAVLSKVLSLAVEYTSLHPRYQPFEVFSQGKLVVKSSNSDDFMWDMFGQLSKMYVDVNPLLAPKRRKLRLYVEGVEKMTGVGVGMEAAGFLERFYTCVGDVHKGTIKEAPVIDNVTASIDEIDDDDIHNDMIYSNSTDDELNFEYGSKEEKNNLTASDNDALDTETDGENDDEYSSADFGNVTNDTTATATFPPTPAKELIPSAFPTILPSIFPTKVPIDTEATSALLSGDANLVLKTLIPCVKDEPTAYLFVDGSMYFKLNITPPFWEAVAFKQDMPAPLTLPAGQGDFFDWTLAVVIITGFIFGVLVMLSRIGVIEEKKVEFWKKKNPGEVETYGQGTPHPFGEDAIPLSMGGRGLANRQGSGGRLVAGQNNRQHNGQVGPGNNQKHAAVEMMSTAPCAIPIKAGTANAADAISPLEQSDVGNDHNNRPPLNTHYLSSVRATKNPDLVDLPDLRFSSRVAVPVSEMRTNITDERKSDNTINDDEWNEDDFVENTSNNGSQHSRDGATALEVV
mmetsp:Transcript_16391/g.20440  ORF Transcript_16391/g.20440 Transcript_16391/m.20440 type:complete len:661 (-) Transcript_16391:117-2099(-)|eukprot:CAMPEP_0172500470 /NCGR_PEP_ID=MMETSP1066-20121228/138859_1 /TAXON_ID=671091 /ORGANISM="Coscinodiscus wailesii, Strain CCMP2513" /LENGTH=660 /DNA_ID=CAMNT_0013274729 /DNA_START=331 /DNA_END=2313 /DNA_ORIENTATION=+